MKTRIVVRVLVVVVMVEIAMLVWTGPNLLHLWNRSTAPCRNNLRVIHGIERTWVFAERKTSNDVPTWTELRPYLGHAGTNIDFKNLVPRCPAGGTYILGRVDDPVRCSIGGPAHSE